MPAEVTQQSGGTKEDADATAVDGELAPGAAGPAARPGTPISDALREQLAQLMHDGSAWMEEHRLAVRWAALAAAAGGVAFLLHTGLVPGWRQYTSLADLPYRLMGPTGPRLPVVLHSVAQRGEVVAVRAAHYPFLRRLLDVYRMLPPSVFAHRGAERGHLLTCYLAGPVQPTIAGLQYLDRLKLKGVHRVRLLSIVDEAEQAWTNSTAAAAAAAALEAGTGVGQAPLAGVAAARGGAGEQPRLQLEAGRLDPGSSQRPTHGLTSTPAWDGVAGGGTAQQQQLLVPRQQDGLAEVSASARDDIWQQHEGQQGVDGEAAKPQHRPMLWGELYAREPRPGLAALLPRRRVDMAETLISRGDAAMMDPVDLEWLGASWRRIDRLHAAEQAAVSAGLGMWAVRRPGLREWTSRLARTAWVRLHRAAQSTAGAAADSIRGTAAATADSLRGTAAATGEKLQGAAAATVDGLRGAAAVTGEKLQGAATATVDGLTRTASATGEKLQGAAAATVDGLTGVASATGEKLKGAAAATVNGLTGVAAATADRLRSAAAAAGTAVGGTLDPKPAAKSVWDKVASTAGEVWGGVTAVGSRARKVAGVAGPGFQRLSKADGNPRNNPSPRGGQPDEGVAASRSGSNELPDDTQQEQTKEQAK